MNWIILLCILLNPSLTHCSFEQLLQDGQAALSEKNKDKALDLLRAAYQEQPNNQDVLFALGSLHYYANEGHIALPYFKKCYEQDPNNFSYIYAYAMAADQIGLFTFARNILEHHFGAEPRHDTLRNKLLPLYLRDMDWYYAGKLCKTDHLWWYNTDISDKTIILNLHSGSHGRGDILHLIRYAKHLHNAGARVIVYVHNYMIPLISQCPYISQVLASNTPQPPSDYVYDLSLEQLTLLMSKTLYTPSLDIPYLYSNPGLDKKWKQMVMQDPHFKVGLCFQSTKMKDYFTGEIFAGPRGIPASQLEPLFSIPGISFYNLQAGEYEQVAHLRTYNNFYVFNNLDTTSGAFMDSAALMKQLDLVITVDTSIAHLAGGLGIPVWVMLPHAADLRWFSDRSDSPWYPTMKLFRQTAHYEWRPVIEQIHAELVKKFKQNKWGPEGPQLNKHQYSLFKSKLSMHGEVIR